MTTEDALSATLDLVEKETGQKFKPETRKHLKLTMLVTRAVLAKHVIEIVNDHTKKKTAKAIIASMLERMSEEERQMLAMGYALEAAGMMDISEDEEDED